MPSTTKTQKISDFVWLNTSFLGDMILMTGAIMLAKTKYPEARHHLISTKLGCEALSSLKLDTYIEFDKSNQRGVVSNIFSVRKKLNRSLRSKESAILFQVHRSYRSGILAMGLGLKTITYLEADFNPRAYIKVPRVAVFHESARIALLLEPVGFSREEILQVKPWLEAQNLNYAADKPWKEQIDKFQGKIVAIAPGSVWGTKKWTRTGFTQLAKRLHADESIGLIILGSNAEIDDAKAISSLLTGRNQVWDLAGKTSIKDLNEIYPHLDVLIANDSSPIHYASAFNVPTVAIFGATIEQMGFGPKADKSIVLGVDLDCRPCSDHGPKTCPLGHFNCMKLIGADRVFEAVKEVSGTRQFIQ